jgi:DNA modification methylase
MGSGKTAIAAEICNRRWIGMDISRHYCQMANDRVKAARKRKNSSFVTAQIVDGSTSIM